MADSEEQVRKVEQAVRKMDREAGEMDRQSGELGSEIDSVREELRRRRNDSNVPGLTPEPEDAEGHEPDQPEDGAPAREEASDQD